MGGDEGGSPKRSARKNSAALAERFSGQLSGQRREAPAGTGPERLLRAPESDDLAPADRPEGRGGPQTPGNPRHRARAAENESRSGLISLADGLRATRNRGRSGGSGRRARGWSQARRVFPAGMKRSVPTPQRERQQRPSSRALSWMTGRSRPAACLSSADPTCVRGVPVPYPESSRRTQPNTYLSPRAPQAWGLPASLQAS